jgi:predicted ATP-grasp superfamily ATP-dependent carboligase
MRIFVYEHLCCGMGRADLPDSLQAEGRAMLSAVLEDFGRIPGVVAQTLPGEHDDPSPRPPGGPGDREEAFRDLARTADYTLVIAPEFDDILLTLCRSVEEAGGRLLGPSPPAVRLAGDKLALGRHLTDRGVPTPTGRPFSPGMAAPDLRFPAVWKPRHGAGSQATFLLKSPDDLAACAARARQEGWKGETLMQPFVPGRPASVAFLVGPRQQVPLPPAAQLLSEEGRFHYRGGVVPLPPDLAGRAVRLAGRAVEAVPGLRGYVGVDLVLGGAADGSEDWVIEINPRLTTSYVGLRALAHTNLAEAMLRVMAGEEVALGWRAGPVHFQAGGRVSVGVSGA